MYGNSTTLNGVILVNKPAGMTSHDVVARVRKLIKQRRVGHAGTLDPLATGLLAVCVGSGTKIARFISEMDKTYEAEIRLGLSSETYDAEGVASNQLEKEIPALYVSELESLLGEFTGIISQKVPAYSAVRIDGKRLYNLARAGKIIETPEREVEITQITLRDFCLPHLRIEVACSSGTYIRSLAHDIGERLGCGAYLSNLSRARIGQLTLNDAMTFEQIERLKTNGTLHEHVLDYHQVLDYGAMLISDDFRKHVFAGRPPKIADVLKTEGIFRRGDRILLKDNNGLVLAVGTAGISSEGLGSTNGESALFSYIRVLN